VRQDIFRAGEGCHRTWLARRPRGSRGHHAALYPRRPLDMAILVVEDRICRRHGSRVVAPNSRMVADELGTHYGRLTARVEVIRNGVNIDRFHPDEAGRMRGPGRHRLGVAAQDTVLVAVGSGFVRKGLATTIRALGQLRRTGAGAPWLLVAGRDEGRWPRALAVREGVGDRVRFLGGVEDSRPLLAVGDAFVLPSLYDPGSSATLEALAMGLPVITTPYNGTAEILEAGVSCWLLDEPGDARELARLLERVADHAACRALGLAGRAAAEPWTWDRHVRDVERVYEWLTGR